MLYWDNFAQTRMRLLHPLAIASLTAAIGICQYVPPGPAVGSPIPAFTARDQNGAERTLSSFAGPKGAMIVFIRSADW